MIQQATLDLAQICAQKGIRDVVLSPGSRCAPLTISFARHPKIEVKTISDERSAAFIGLGMALQSGHPVALVCTSGSAAYNYAPAVAEAFFQQVPLVLFTADRPPEWIGQLDGQAIYQQNIFGRHVKGSFELPTDTSHPDTQWHHNRIIAEAINLSNQFPQGPVHINVPFREPFYPSVGQKIEFTEDIKTINTVYNTPSLPSSVFAQLREKWINADKKLIVGGQSKKDKAMASVLEQIIQTQKIPVLGDVISNLHEVDEAIVHQDAFLVQEDQELLESLQPDLLITYGKSVISKNLKLFLRRYRPKLHWHIQPAGPVADTFQSLTDIVRVNPLSFFKNMSSLTVEEGFSYQKQDNFLKLWQIEERKTQRITHEFVKEQHFGEFKAYAEVIEKIPPGADVHLANSMAVRYANFVGVKKKNQIEIFANRGTSGIDGSNSTALGTALKSGKPTYLLTGDLAFFYDRNAFWNNYVPDNLRIVVFNNHAGGIFRIINGPSQLPELEELFETKQALTAKLLAKEFGFEYILCDNERKLKNSLKAFFEEDEKLKRPKILEIETDSQENKAILDMFKSKFTFKGE